MYETMLIVMKKTVNGRDRSFEAKREVDTNEASNDWRQQRLQAASGSSESHTYHWMILTPLRDEKKTRGKPVWMLCYNDISANLMD